MSFLDANVGQLAKSASGVMDSSAMFRSTLAEAMATAEAARANHMGESAMAFQASHARFVSGAEKLNHLLDLAGVNVEDAGTEYVAQDGVGADAYNSVPMTDGGGISIRA